MAKIMELLLALLVCFSLVTGTYFSMSLFHYSSYIVYVYIQSFNFLKRKLKYKVINFLINICKMNYCMQDLQEIMKCARDIFIMHIAAQETLMLVLAFAMTKKIRAVQFATSVIVTLIPTMFFASVLIIVKIELRKNFRS